MCLQETIPGRARRQSGARDTGWDTGTVDVSITPITPMSLHACMSFFHGQGADRFSCTLGHYYGLRSVFKYGKSKKQKGNPKSEKVFMFLVSVSETG